MGNEKTYKSDLRELVQTFSRLVLSEERIYSNVAKVLSVNEIGGAQVEAVRLQQVACDDGLLLVPVVGSLVIISYTDKTTAFVSMFSQIEKIIFQGGSNLGIPKTPETVERLNNIEKDINDLKQILATWVPVATDGGASLKSASASWYTSTLTPTTNDDIQNQNFLQ